MNQLKNSLLRLLSSDEYDVVIQNAGIFRFPASYRFETHSHAAFEINYVNTGSCIMEVSGDYVPLKQGDCIVINPYAKHCFMVDLQKTCKITQLEMIVFTPTQIEGISFLKKEGSYYKLHNCENIAHILENISRYNRSGRVDSYTKTQLDFAMAGLYVALSYYIDRANENVGTEKNDKVSKFIRFINENIESELNIEDISEEFGISSRYIRKYFLQNMGMKATEYITILRLRKAKELLWDPSNSITDVALKTGFNSSQYFCRVFHEKIGMTPMKYRQMWRDQSPQSDTDLIQS